VTDFPPSAATTDAVLHSVHITWNPGVDEAHVMRVAEALNTYAATVPELLFFRAGSDLRAAREHRRLWNRGVVRQHPNGRPTSSSSKAVSAHSATHSAACLAPPDCSPTLSHRSVRLNDASATVLDGLYAAAAGSDPLTSKQDAVCTYFRCAPVRVIALAGRFVRSG
jgi:hypothetical protein